jgi:hypothetical protein
MSKQTEVVITCDKCYKIVPKGDEYVDAGTYGMYFHTICWDDSNGSAVAKMLGLDDIRICVDDEYVRRVY